MPFVQYNRGDAWGYVAFDKALSDEDVKYVREKIATLGGKPVTWSFLEGAHPRLRMALSPLTSLYRGHREGVPDRTRHLRRQTRAALRVARQRPRGRARGPGRAWRTRGPWWARRPRREPRARGPQRGARGQGRRREEGRRRGAGGREAQARGGARRRAAHGHARRGGAEHREREEGAHGGGVGCRPVWRCVF